MQSFEGNLQPYMTIIEKERGLKSMTSASSLRIQIRRTNEAQRKQKKEVVNMWAEINETKGQIVEKSWELVLWKDL